MNFLHYERLANSRVQQHLIAPNKSTKKPLQKQSREAKSGGSYRIRICDLIHVKDAL